MIAKNSPVVQFCVDECKRQNDYSPETVGAMVEAWFYAVELGEFNIYADNIKKLGEIVKPQNYDWRKTPVVFQNGDKGVSYDQIERLIPVLIASYYDGSLSTNEFYYEFEKIHPFEDGNGRVDAILWNIFSGNIENPICPPGMF